MRPDRRVICARSTTGRHQPPPAFIGEVPGEGLREAFREAGIRHRLLTLHSSRRDLEPSVRQALIGYVRQHFGGATGRGGLAAAVGRSTMNGWKQQGTAVVRSAAPSEGYENLRISVELFDEDTGKTAVFISNFNN